MRADRQTDPNVLRKLNEDNECDDVERYLIDCYCVWVRHDDVAREQDIVVAAIKVRVGDAVKKPVRPVDALYYLVHCDSIRPDDTPVAVDHRPNVCTVHPRRHDARIRSCPVCPEHAAEANTVCTVSSPHHYGHLTSKVTSPLRSPH